MILGFTGTRRGMTPAQRAALPSVIATLPARVLHGGAEGADTEFHNWIASLYHNHGPCWPIDVYPASKRSYKSWCVLLAPVSGAVVRLWEDPLTRNDIIARRCDHLLGVPETQLETLRSGTWATVRYARWAGKSVTLLLPDGTVKEERR